MLGLKAKERRGRVWPRKVRSREGSGMVRFCWGELWRGLVIEVVFWNILIVVVDDVVVCV